MHNVQTNSDFPRRFAKAALLAVQKQKHNLVVAEFEPTHVPSLRDQLRSQRRTLDKIVAESSQLCALTEDVQSSLNDWRQMLGRCEAELAAVGDAVWVTEESLLYQMVISRDNQTSDLVECVLQVLSRLLDFYNRAKRDSIGGTNGSNPGL